ncbi:MAG: hypothetical protein QF561_06340 [Phycisphaerales bacterium]|nr:hypothetical protein [Phycisphaerales bacterium]
MGDKQLEPNDRAGIDMLTVLVAIRRRWWVVLALTVLAVIASVPVGDVVDGEMQTIQVAVEIGRVPRRVVHQSSHTAWDLRSTLQGSGELASSVEWAKTSVLAEFNAARVSAGQRPWKDLKLVVAPGGGDLLVLSTEVPVRRAEDGLAVMNDVATAVVGLIGLEAERAMARAEGATERLEYQVELQEARLLAETADLVQRQRLAEARRAKLEDEVLAAKDRAALEQAKAQALAVLSSHESALTAAESERETLLHSLGMLQRRIDELDALIAADDDAAASLSEHASGSPPSGSEDLLALAMESLDDRHARWIGERYQTLRSLAVDVPLELASIDERMATLRTRIAAQKSVCAAATQQLLAEPVVRSFDVQEAALGAQTAKTLSAGVETTIAIDAETIRRTLQEVVELRGLASLPTVLNSGAVLGAVSRPVPIVVVWVLAALIGCLVGVNVLVVSAILEGANGAGPAA